MIIKQSMAQFHFYCVAPDYPKVIEAICKDSDFRVMPCWHPEKRIPVYDQYSDELARFIVTNKSLRIVGPFSIEGVCVEKTVRGNYEVAKEKWGPLIGLTLGGSRI